MPNSMTFNTIKPKFQHERNLPKIPTRENIMKVISASSFKYATIFRILLETGVMPYELSRTKVTDIDLEREVLIIRGYKGHSSRVFKLSNETLLEAYALTYNYNETMTAASNVTYVIPKFLDKSPIVLVVTGTNSTIFFAEWTAYSQIPFEMGANMQSSEIASFTYIVNINQAFYLIKIQCGGPSE